MRKGFLPYAGAAIVAISAPAASWAQGSDIVETAKAAGNFKTFEKAILEAGLTETLKGPGPFTVFAPTDEAFAKLPPGRLAALLKDKSALKEVLLYHVVTGRVMADDIAKLNGKSKKTAEGGDAKIMMMGSGIMVNNANVTKSDILASNGVIHVVDAVMMPPGK
ncbi:MAG: fasciclin domain-containing protein [Phycisphaerae bacterium]|nr:fasciclin domain-containing protein [Gemmatimonadaceae bacterium]